MTDGLILQIVVPLMSAPLCVLLRNGVAAAAVSLLVAVYAFANGIVLLQTVQEHGTISYLVGSVAIPYGI